MVHLFTTYVLPVRQRKDDFFYNLGLPQDLGKYSHITST